MTRAAFFGSPDFAIPCLEALHEIADIVCVFSQPDRPSGRGMKLRPPPVKARALELGLRVEQPSGIRTPEFAEFFRSLELDVAIVVAYGRILPPEILEAPRFGCLNIHASLLPKYRGAAPIQWAIANGEKETGVALMQMDEGLDTGDILLEYEVPITPSHTAATLHDELAQAGARAIVEAITRLEQDSLRARPQPEAGVTYAAKLDKSEAALDFTRPAAELARRVRAFDPVPGATMRLPGLDQPVKVWSATALDQHSGAVAGELVKVSPQGIDVATGEGVLRVLELQKAGGKRQPVSAFVQGWHPA